MKFTPLYRSIYTFSILLLHMQDCTVYAGHGHSILLYALHDLFQVRGGGGFKANRQEAVYL